MRRLVGIRIESHVETVLVVCSAKFTHDGSYATIRIIEKVINKINCT